MGDGKPSDITSDPDLAQSLPVEQIVR